MPLSHAVAVIDDMHAERLPLFTLGPAPDEVNHPMPMITDLSFLVGTKIIAITCTRLIVILQKLRIATAPSFGI